MSASDYILATFGLVISALIVGSGLVLILATQEGRSSMLSSLFVLGFWIFAGGWFMGVLVNENWRWIV